MTTPAKLEADWLSAPASRSVIDALQARRPGSARFVGGCVRNALMGRPVDDLDIATQLPPDAVMEALKAAGIRAIPTGIDHGTVTAVIGGEGIEITTLRRDVETDGRRAVVAFTEDWAEDAARRDFRLNALYVTPDGTLHDPTGGGIADAAAGRVIFIGDADQRLKEDYLRILRFFRFNAWYGAEMDAAGLAACERQKAGLAQIAAERVWKEFRKLLAAPRPGAAVQAMQETSVLAAIIGDDLGGAHRTVRLVAAERAAGEAPDPMRRLLTLVPGSQGWIDQFAGRLRLSRSDHGRLSAWANPDLPAVGAGPPAAIRAALYRYGAEAVLDRALVEHARSNAPVTEPFLSLVRTWTPPRFPLGGADAKAAGLTGPAIGEALRAAEARWIDSDFQSNRQDLQVRLAAHRNEP
ncbi:MAG: CCA tRNA nucleotidyltransferase [Pseudomonadota bacterium]